MCNVADTRGERVLKGYRLMILFSTFVIGLPLTGAASAGLGCIPGLSERGVLLLTSVVQCVLAFMLPAWITGKVTTRDSFQWLCLRKAPRVRALMGVIIVYALALPAMNQLISWNESVHFPDSLNWLESTLRNSENAAREISGKILDEMSVWNMLAAVGVVGLLTGLSEEMFFRGGLQNILASGGKSTFAIWVAAIVFSLLHFQFFGFVPRVMMGVFFGYLLLWTGNLWVAAFAHALNNSVVVVSSYAMSGETALCNLDTVGIAPGGEVPWAALTSCVATALFFWKFRTFFFKQHQAAPGK